MVRFIAVVAAVLVGSPVLGAADSPRQQYLIKVRLVEHCDDHCQANDKTRVLAEPKLVTVEGREANYLVGGQMTVGDTAIDFGTSLKLHIEGADAGAVNVKGVVETSQVDQGRENLATRNSTAIYFQRSLELGKTARYELAQPNGATRVLEFSIEKVTGLPPDSVVSQDAPADVPRPVSSGASAVRR